MICVPYYISDSKILNAGKGLFVCEDIPRGSVITAPTEIDRTVSIDEVLEGDDHGLDSSARWFENHYTLSPDWPDECYINHAFDPTGLWHLGFVFSAIDIKAGGEVTLDYRHIIIPGFKMPFLDSLTGREIVGFTWEESLHASAEYIYELSLDMLEMSKARN